MSKVNKFLLIGCSVSLYLSLTGCGGSDTITTSTDDENTNSTSVVIPTSYTANAGRLLGSQCAQCHGTNGISVTDWDSIAGEDELESEIFEDDEPIMNAQAHGYTTDEIALIGDWLRTLKN
ncbi:MAG TPA: cytochrome c class I [Campylobacterales bacterium]|nr:cytochrome c class I [Campylobacterales bacterium]HIP45974.1 cytochrome c class I [Campylobacterales bacterium]